MPLSIVREDEEVSVTAWTDPYVDARWNATSVLLSLARIEQKRPISTDEKDLLAMVSALSAFAERKYEQESPPALFSRIEGLLVFVTTVRDLYPRCTGTGIRQHAHNLATLLRGVLHGEGAGMARLRKFFQKAHDVAEEMTALGVHVDPVVEVFGMLSAK